MKNWIIIFLLSVNSSSIFSQDTFKSLDVFELQYVSDPQISPDGSKIIYVRTKMDIMKDGRSSSIWIINSDGSNHQKLTSNSFSESSPRWSPDGKKISFISSIDDSNGTEIYMYWLDSKQYSSISQLDESPRSLKWSRAVSYTHLTLPTKRIV